jgi:glucose-6-phosphate isomerase
LVEETPDYEDDVLAIYGANSVKDISNHLSGHYLAIMAYLNREVDTDVTELRAKLADKLNIGVTFGWGPRFLHSTGQFHKGGQPNGAFLQITGESEIDFPIPGKDFTFQRLFIAQAKGDAKALASRNYPLVRVHLKNRKKGIAKLVKEI